MKSLNRYEIVKEVRSILRDDGKAKEEICEAINRVIGKINNTGRFRFQESSFDIDLEAATYKYALESDVLADDTVIFAPGVSGKQRVLNKRSELVDAFSDGRFMNQADQPSDYWIWGGEMYFDPIPNTTAAANIVRIYGYRDLTELNGDLEEPSALPARYHRTVLANGAAAELAPDAMLRIGDRSLSVQKAFEIELNKLVAQEEWKPHNVQNIGRDSRYAAMDTWGHVSTIR